MEFKRRHYAGWPDDPLPALDGQTPRDAVRTKKGRHAVEVLLKHLEHEEERASGGAPFNFAELREELGLR